MNACHILVRMVATVQIPSTALSVFVHLDLMAHSVKKASVFISILVISLLHILQFQWNLGACHVICKRQIEGISDPVSFALGFHSAHSLVKSLGNSHLVGNNLCLIWVTSY